MRRRTKIVATLGPATDDPQVLEGIIAAGVNVARINFSHGNAEEHLARIERFRAEAKRQNQVVAILGDLPGPKLRVKVTSAMPLHVGETITFSCRDEAVEANDIVITEPEVLHDVQPDHRILLDDGRLQLIALQREGDRLFAKVTVGGTLKPNKGLNLPDTPLSIAAVTERDIAALAIAAQADVDWLALSFVRSPDAANELRQAAAAAGIHDIPVLAKVERPEAVEAIDAIVRAFDGVMVARGDLGVEMPLEMVPTVQKMLIKAAREQGKPVITATDMLDSMRSNPRPTRAEASDVANAIFDGTDAVMLSGETAIGEYPVETVNCMARIAIEAENHFRRSKLEVSQEIKSIDEALAQVACQLAEQVNATAIVTPTISGRTARILARFRPSARIIAPAPSLRVVRKMAFVWGLTPVPMAPLSYGDSRMVASVRDAFNAGEVSVGERVVVLAGHPLEGGPRYPTVRVVKVGEAGRSEEPQ